MEEEPKKPEKPKKITVSGVSFSADQVKNATVIIDGREIFIGEATKPKKIGF